MKVERDIAAKVFEHRARIKAAADAHAAIMAAADADPGRVAVYVGKINLAGVITVCGRRYWSDELCARAGMEVEVHLDLDGPYASVWSKGRMHRLCTAALLDDGPYADATSIDAMRETAQKLKVERASVVRRQIAELLHIVDERVERAILRAEARQARARQYRIANIPGLLRAAWNLAFKNSHVCKQEPAQGVDLDLEKIEAVLRAGGIGLFGHSIAPSAADTAEPTAAPASPHRLSETPE